MSTNMNGTTEEIRNKTTPINTTAVITPSLNYDKDKKWQNELLMERLKSKGTQRTFQEMSKAMRMALLEKRYALDHVEKANLQKCLDSMQHCIKVTSRQGLVERLESLTRQLGLKFMEDPSGLFISSDMFYLEIVLDPSGIVQDVKVHHEGNIEQQSCKELVNCLVKGDFVDFTQQLEGLASIYQLNAEQKIKTKAFVALQALETDLTNIYMFQNILKDPQVLLYKSAVGMLQPRRGGHPMKLTFFISPYDLLDFENRNVSPIDAKSTKSIGMSVTVNLEASGANKLQIQPILMVNKDQQGRSTPVSAPLSPLNSTMFPASFVLRLSKPMPMSYSFVQQIKHTTELDFGDTTALTPMLSLIVNYETDGEINSISKGLFVSLPEQNHCYFVTNTKSLDGIVIKSVPFTEPSHVPHILNFLRLQAAFNSLISSCIRLKGRQDIENAIMFEISAISCNVIVVSLEHPYEESMATVEINLTDLSSIVCKIYSLTRNYDHIAVKLSKVIQKCMSIPIAMRTLIKYWDQENQLKVLNGANFNLSHGPSDPGGRSNGNSTTGGGGGGGGVGAGGGGNSGQNLNVLPGIGNGNNNFGHNMIKSMSGGNNCVAKNGTNVNGNSNSSNPSNRSMFHQNPNFNEHNLNSLFNSSESSSIANQDPLSFNNDLSSSSKASKKRRTNLMNEDFWKSPKSNNANNSNETSELLECSNNSSDSNSLGTSSVSVLSETGVATPNSNPGFNNNSSDIDQPSSDNRTMSDDCDLSDSELMHKKVTNKKPSVSITPISTNLQSVLTGMNLELRTGIEILPFTTSSTTQNLPSSITITPINSSSNSPSSSSKATVSGDGNKKSSTKSGSSENSSKQRRSSSDDKKQEKKKKRKRDESPMGPPEKLPPKQQDSLNKPISVSIKSSDGSPVSPSNVLKKFASSPKSVGSNSVNSSLSNPPKQSPKNSPIYHGSPKHLSSGLHSPKSSPLATTSLSPKHLPSSGSGKPSMSQLKSVTNSPSSKTSSDKSKSSSSHRDRSSSGDKKSGSSSPKLKQTSVKLKQLDLSLISPIDLITNIGNCDPVNMSSTSPTDLNKLNSNRNRKGSLSAVIDKLKSAQNLPEDLPSPGGSSSSSGGNSNSNSSSSSSKFQNSSSASSKEKISSASNNQNLNKDSSSKGNSSGHIKNLTLSANPGSNLNANKSTEYMVKPSSDGIKLTINKTRTKENNSLKDGISKISSSGSGSSKSSSQLSFKSGSSKSKSGSSSSSLQKSSSSGNLTSSMSSSKSLSSSSKSGGLPKTQSSGSLSALTSLNSSDSKLKDKSGKSSKIFSSGDRSHYYQGPRDPNDVRKLLGFATSSSPSIDGFIKSFDTKKFQIPKLSARTSNPTTSPNLGNSTTTNPSLPNSFVDLKRDMKHTNSTITNTGSTAANENHVENDSATKMLVDLLSKEIPQKFPFSVNKIPLEAPPSNLKVNSLAVPNNPHPQYGGSGGGPISGSDLSAYAAKELLDGKKQQHGMDYTTATLNESPKLLNNSLIDSVVSAKLMRPPSAPPVVPSNVQLPPKQSPILDEVLDFSAQSSSAAVSSAAATSRTITPPLLPASVMLQQSVKDLKLMQPTSLMRKSTTSPFPSSPSVSVHIVKSPVPSPLMVIQSPHSSNSPCITDDELMDEALVGISGK